jgi:hypothetical protein
MATSEAERTRLRPSVGTRLLLDRIAIDGGHAHYQAWILSLERETSYHADLDDTGAVTLTPSSASARPDEEAALHMLAKLTARGARKRADDGLPPWPPRVLRWRGPGRGA